MKKQSIIVSSCLLGELCRYDGTAKNTLELSNVLDNYNIIPFCPEAPLFGTPRERISVVIVHGKNRIWIDNTKVDVTDKLVDYIDDFLSLHKEVTLALLKSKSPSCGYKTTPVLDVDLKKLFNGNGIAAQMFEDKGLEVIDEMNFLEKLI